MAGEVSREELRAAALKAQEIGMARVEEQSRARADTLKRRSKKTKLVEDLAGFLYRNGSCGLVLLGGSSPGNVNNGLRGLYGDSAFFVDSKGILQGAPKRPQTVELIKNLLEGFCEKTGKDGLIVVRGHNFGGSGTGGAPAINTMLEETANKAGRPQLLVMGHGSTMDLPKTPGYSPAGIVGCLAGVAAYNGQEIIMPEGILAERVERGLMAPSNPQAPSQSGAGLRSIPLTTRPEQHTGYVRL